jgi:glycosyltransferase involved in cell wall biosynthesis
VRRIGFLGALTKEKGIFEFLNTAVILWKRHPELRFSIAGPCHDARIRDEVENACRNHPFIDYAGPLYGAEKNAFVQSLDLLLFPTSYRNEAEPLVIWEAMSSGIPVIGWDRGCIGEMLAEGKLQSTVISRDSPFAETAATKIENWLLAPEIYRQRSAEVRAQFERASSQSRLNLDRIFHGVFLEASEMKSG